VAANDIIYLNGPSSAGKTTLSRALQERLPEPYLYLGIDTLIEMMPTKVNDWGGAGNAIGYSFQKVTDGGGQTTYRVVAGEYGAKMFPAFRAMVSALARCGLKLIIDDIAFGEEPARLWRACLRDFATLWVGVTASAETLIAREAARGDRLIGSARDQLGRVHRDVTYDLFIDTTALSIDETTDRIVAYLAAAGPCTEQAVSATIQRDNKDAPISYERGPGRG
jgi:chloramphenicol 3-O phosphotransferase